MASPAHPDDAPNAPPPPASAPAAPAAPDKPPEDSQIRKALREAGAEHKAAPRVATGHKLALGTYLFVLLALAAARYGLDFEIFHFSLSGEARGFLRRLLLAAMIGDIILALGHLLKYFALPRIEDTGSRYNLRRLVSLIAALIIVFIALSVLFQNWYTAVVSLGLASVIAGFALQDPMTSFIGWVYLVVKEPYRVGDRIQIGEATGDVIAISYLDTTLWEFGGPYLSTDHPSGRIIRFPNAKVLDEMVYNYTWPVFPYIWQEIYVQVAYGADLEFVSKTMREVTEEALGQAMLKRIESYRTLLERTPVDELQVKEHPVVLYRVSQNTWVEVACRYLVEPRRAGTVRSHLTHEAVRRLNVAPERVMFPKGDAR